MTQKTRRMTHKQRPVRSRLAGAGILAVAASGIVLLAAASTSCGGSSAAANTSARPRPTPRWPFALRATACAASAYPDGAATSTPIQSHPVPEETRPCTHVPVVLPNAGTGLTVTQHTDDPAAEPAQRG